MIPQIPMDDNGDLIPFDDSHDGIAALYLQDFTDDSPLWDALIDIQDDYNALVDTYNEVRWEGQEWLQEGKQDLILEELHYLLRSLSRVVRAQIAGKLGEA